MPNVSIVGLAHVGAFSKQGVRFVEEKHGACTFGSFEDAVQSARVPSGEIVRKRAISSTVVTNGALEDPR